MEPRNIEEDMSSEINHNPNVDIVYYKVTLGASAHNPFRVENVYTSYTFVTPGMSDVRRMRRALCYFDKALFREGIHRHRITDNQYESTRTGRLFRAMSEAYVAFSEIMYKCDSEASIFIASLERTSEIPVIVPVEPLINILYSPLHPLAYDDLSICRHCLRVEEGKAKDASNHVCVNCVK